MYHRGLSCHCVSIADEQLSLLSVLPDSHMSHKDISNPLVAIADVWLRIHTITKLINRLGPIVHHHQAATKGARESMGGFILFNSCAQQDNFGFGGMFHKNYSHINFSVWSS